MWTPQDIDEFEAAVNEGVLEEKHDFDAKRELPKSGKELAKDIAAMTTDGGALIYGVGEDQNGQPRLLTPIALDGARERIDQIAQHSISGTPRIDFVVLRSEDDPGFGYLVVNIPASPRAPHQVIVGDDRRFYGRSESGNRRLSEAEIERLYERRRRQNLDREQLLAQCVDASPLGLATPGRIGFLQAFAQPTIPDDNLWDYAVETNGSEQTLLEVLRSACAAVPIPEWGGAQLGHVYNWRQRGADKWSLARILRQAARSKPTGPQAA